MTSASVDPWGRADAPAPPDATAFTAAERDLVAALNTPARLQRYLTALPYNPQDTVRSFRAVAAAGSGHCLEGVLFAATVLEQHGHAPVMLNLASQDDLDHGVLVYRRHRRFGAVAASQYPGLHGRRAVYTSLHHLARSYYDPYVDKTGRLIAFGVVDLRDVASDWRFGASDQWAVQRAIHATPHAELPSSDERYERVRRRYLRFEEQHPRAEPTYFASRANWLQ